MVPPTETALKRNEAQNTWKNLPFLVRACKPPKSRCIGSRAQMFLVTTPEFGAPDYARDMPDRVPGGISYFTLTCGRKLQHVLEHRFVAALPAWIP
jgi:hypothetical protein